MLPKQYTQQGWTNFVQIIKHNKLNEALCAKFLLMHNSLWILRDMSHFFVNYRPYFLCAIFCSILNSFQFWGNKFALKCIWNCNSRYIIILNCVLFKVWKKDCGAYEITKWIYKLLAMSCFTVMHMPIILTKRYVHRE